jgi:hypothetical protein
LEAGQVGDKAQPSDVTAAAISLIDTASLPDAKQ